MGRKTIDGGKYVVMHEYYMKDVASKAVLNDRSAVPYSMKRTVLTQEALRVLLNCSRELPWERVVFFLNVFMARYSYHGTVPPLGTKSLTRPSLRMIVC